MKNEVHVSKLITEMPKLNMSHNARLVLYTVLKKSWQTFRNREDYISKDILTKEDFEEAQKPINLKLCDLKPLFKHNATFKEIKEHILKIPYEARFKTYYTLQGKKTNMLMDTKISLFKGVQANDKEKTIMFTPASHLLNYIEALKNFAKVDIEEMKELNGNYAIRAYELICQNNYLDVNNNKLIDDEVRKIRMEDFRRYFEIPKTYNTSNIDMRVLRPIMKAINKHTKYNIIEIKKFKLDVNDKKKVTHYRIDVEYKQKKEEFQPDYKETEYIKQFRKRFKDKYQDTLLEKYTREMYNKKGPKIMDYYLDKFQEILDSSTKDIKRIAGYFYATVMNELPLQNSYKTTINKPIQSTNFDQRKYSDEFFESLYENPEKKV